MDKELKRRLVAEVKRRTAVADGRERGFSKRARELAEAAVKVGGCKREALFALVELMTGVKLPKPPNSVHHEPLVCVVPTQQEGGHSYTIGKPTVICYRDIGVRGNGTTGNHLPEIGTGAIRYATEAEIDTFFKSEKAAEGVLKHVAIVF